MKYRSSIVVLLLTCIILSLLAVDSDEHDSVTLAELASVKEKDGVPAVTKIDFTDAVTIRDMFSAGLEMTSIFYVVLAVCGVVIAIRAVISILRALQAERLRAVQRTYELRDNVSRLARGSIEAPAAVSPFATQAEDHGAEERWNRRNPSAALFGSSRVAQFLKGCTQGVTGKMVFTFAGIVAAFGLLAIALVYFSLTSALRKHVIQRATITAVNVGDGAPRFLLKNNAAGLRELLREHAAKPELAYILVENRAGEIFAHNFAVLPQEIQDRPSLGNDPAAGRRTLRIGESVVEEVSAPILEGRGGAVRVGIWRESIDAEINEVVIPQIKVLAAVVACGVLVAAFLAWWINRPIRRLVAAAKAISIGDLDRPAPRLEDAGEFGELSRAIERMRSSVKAAMSRLAR